MITRIFRKISHLATMLLVPLDEQARRAGVVMGKNNHILGRFWSSEPYLINIGDNCQITNGVRLQTHGGG